MTSGALGRAFEAFYARVSKYYAVKELRHLVEHGTGAQERPAAGKEQELQSLKVRRVFQAYQSFTGRRAQIEHLPLELHLAHTERCNLRCPMCAAHALAGVNKAGDMDDDLLERLRPHFGGVLVGRILGAGEPLLSRNFMPLARSLKENHCHTATTTNATLLTSEVAAELVQMKFNNIIVSFDAGTAATYERIRMGAKFNRVVGNIKSLIELRQGSSFPRVSFSMVGMQQNIGELPEMLRLMSKLGVKHLAIVPLSVPGGLGDFVEYYKKEALCFMDPEAVKGALRDAQKLADSLSIRMRYSVESMTRQPPEHLLAAGSKTPAAAKPVGNRPSSRPNMGFYGEDKVSEYAASREERATPGYCAWPWVVMHVLSDGKVALCCKASSIIMGDLKTQSMEEIFHGKAMTSVRRVVAAGGFACVQCERCYFRGNYAQFDNYLDIMIQVISRIRESSGTNQFKISAS